MQRVYLRVCCCCFNTVYTSLGAMITFYRHVYHGHVLCTFTFWGPALVYAAWAAVHICIRVDLHMLIVPLDSPVHSITIVPFIDMYFP